MFPIDQFQRAIEQVNHIGEIVRRLEQSTSVIRDALGRIEERQLSDCPFLKLTDREFKVYSQWGEDGIIQQLVRSVKIANPIFVEFGVENYTEANTRYLLTRNNWSGLIFDGSEANIASVRHDPIYWRHNLKAVSAFITKENINTLLHDNGITGEIGLLSIDVDGVDYWIWDAINVVEPTIVIVEYNSLFGPDRAVTVPYDPEFARAKAHYSHCYYGASLAALVGLGRRKGYAFVGCNSAGNNAFFVRRNQLSATIKELTVTEGYVAHSFREARDERGKLRFSSHEEDSTLVNSLPLVEVPAE